MIGSVHQLEMRAIMAEKEREARAALRVSEAKRAPRGPTAGFAGRLARPGTQAKRERARLSPSSTLRGPSVHEP